MSSKRPKSPADEQDSALVALDEQAAFLPLPQPPSSSRAVQDCEEVLAASPWERKCAKRRMEALQALGFSSAAYQVAQDGNRKIMSVQPVIACC